MAAQRAAQQQQQAAAEAVVALHGSRAAEQCLQQQLDAAAQVCVNGELWLYITETSQEAESMRSQLAQAQEAAQRAQQGALSSSQDAAALQARTQALLVHISSCHTTSSHAVCQEVLCVKRSCAGAADGVTAGTGNAAGRQRSPP